MGELRVTLKVTCSSVCHFTSKKLKKKKKKKKKKKNDVLIVGDLPLMQYGGNLIRDNKITYATLHYTFTKITALLRASRVRGSFEMIFFRSDRCAAMPY